MIYQTDIREFSGLRCRIQARQCLDGSIQQRHIWYRDMLGDCDPPRVDAWIASCTRKPELAFRGMTPAPDVRDEQDELIAALREIEAGHNDPRRRAAEALAAAGLI